MKRMRLTLRKVTLTIDNRTAAERSTDDAIAELIREQRVDPSPWIRFSPSHEQSKVAIVPIEDLRVEYPDE